MIKKLQVFLSFLLLGMFLSEALSAPLILLSPAPDSVVREKVPITVPASSVPPRGYLMIFIDGEFHTAVARPRRGNRIVYMWDTKAKTGSREEVGVPDGKHESRVWAVDQENRPVSNVERIEVFVQNRVRSAPSYIRLRYDWRVGQELNYSQKITEKNGGIQVYTARVYVKQRTDDFLPEGLALVREKVERDSTELRDNQPGPFQLAGLSYSLYANSSGTYRLGSKARSLRVKPVIRPVPVPPYPVRVGDIWTAPLSIPVRYLMLDELRVPARHTLKGFEWESGRPCAKVVSTFDTTVDTRLPGTGILQSWKIKGERISYIAYKVGKLIRYEDRFTLTPSLGTVTFSQPGTGAVTPTPTGGIGGPYGASPYPYRSPYGYGRPPGYGGYPPTYTGTPSPGALGGEGSAGTGEVNVIEVESVTQFIG